jgi:hypothetical protein
MRCEYKDGLKIDYAGSLIVKKSGDIDGFLIKENSIPEHIRYELDKAVLNDSCSEMREVAGALTSTVCGTVCLRKK